MPPWPVSCAPSRHIGAALVELARGALTLSVVGLSLAVSSPPAFAQAVLPKGTRPSERQPELPRIEERQPTPELVLPPIPQEPPAQRERLGSAPRVFVRSFRIEGSTVFSEEELAAVVEPWTNRDLATEDLRAVSNAITLHYVNHGYVTSGAVIPDQKVLGGVIEIRIVEGRLARVEVGGNRFFRSRYFSDRLNLAAGFPLDVNALEQRLQLFQQDSRIERIHAELAPDVRQGEAVLRLRVAERSPYHLALEFDNHESPSIGAERGHILVWDDNLTGRGDVLQLEYGLTRGLDDLRASYETPFNAWDSALELHFQRSDSVVVEAPFDEIDIESETETYGFRLSHPAYRSPAALLTLSVTGEYRESRNFLLGDRFDFSGVLGDSREAVVSVIRFGQDWTYRTSTQVVAARSTVSVGLDVLGATRNRGRLADGQFLSWLGQFQWARRFDRLGVELVARTDVQLTTSPLLSLEQFAIGGANTVRGYRENEIVRDMGAIGSLELRIPVWQTRDGLTRIQLAPFFDIGHGWNTRRATPSPRTIAGVGIGLRGALTRFLQYELYLAEDLRRASKPSEHDLQDSGIHFRIYVPLF